MAFDKNSVKGAQGFSVRVKALSFRAPGMLGFTTCSRETIDTPGVFGMSVCISGNAFLNVRLTSFAPITQPLTVAISWAGHTAEVYGFDANFVAVRNLPVNTLLTFTTSGTGYATTVTTATLISASSVTSIDVLAVIVLSSSAYRRRRYI